MTNPNNCSTCDHKAHPDGGWCYMFRHEPKEACPCHTGRERGLASVLPVLVAAAHVSRGQDIGQDQMVSKSSK